MSPAKTTTGKASANGHANPTAAAKRAIADMVKHESAMEAARARRDRAIHDMRGLGMNPPAIARALDLSISLVRLTLKVPPPD